MAVKNGLPATDFSKMNRDYIRNVAEGETVKDGLPATDFSRMNRDYIKAVVEEAGGGGGDVTVEALSVTENGEYSEEGKAYSPVTVNVKSLADTIFPVQATATVIITAADEADLATVVWDVLAIKIDNDWSLVETTSPLTLSPGTTEMVFFACTENGAGFEYDSSAWTITVTSGDAVIEHEDSSYWVTITGDCTLTCVKN